MTDAQLITHILSAYALTKDDIADLTTHIATSRLNVAQASYRRAQHTTGLRPNYTATKALQRRIEQQSAKAAQSIAETYQDMLRSFLETLLDARSLSKTWNDLFSNVRDAVKTMVTAIGSWLGDFLPWKTKQIANMACGSGLNDGVTEFMQDVLKADKGDGTVKDDDGNMVVDLNTIDLGVGEMGVRVEPSDSSSDYCKTYAGNEYSISEYLSLGIDFPAHVSCIHYPVVIVMQ